MTPVVVAASMFAMMLAAPRAAPAQGAPSMATVSASAGKQLGLAAPVRAAPFPLASELMREGDGRHPPGFSLIVVGAIGMLAGLLFHNGDVLLVATVVTAVGLIVYLF